jgi:hypothetical protein
MDHPELARGIVVGGDLWPAADAGIGGGVAGVTRIRGGGSEASGASGNRLVGLRAGPKNLTIAEA